MFRQCLKLFTLLCILWIVILIIISRKFVITQLDKDYQLYEIALKKLKHHTNVTEIDAWNLVGPGNPQLSIKDRLSVIRNKEYPLGTLGKPVHMQDDVKIRGVVRMRVAKGWQDNSFNQFVSDLIPIDRSLPDFRDKWCLQRNSKEDPVLPEATVVICFHNEARSTLLRTIHSVLNRSPEHLLREIILVDDFSTMTHLKTKLDKYILHLPKIRMIRTIRREGLIRARIMGVKMVVTPIVIFIDSHCECTNGWLEPLLERIAIDSKAVVSPVIDHIDTSTFEYIAQDPKDIRIGGFNWFLKFIWRPLEEIKERDNLLAPIKTPTIAGGLFAINLDFFKHIGYYDDGFDIWGGENLELSFKVWMCGGSLEIVPCSHVGHIFRENFPYRTKGSFKRNSVRLAEVWLDEYAHFYFQRIGFFKGDFGNVTSRKELRKNLKCKSFDWYVNNVYPELKDSLTNAASGQIYNIANYAICLDAGSYYIGGVSVLPCHQLGGNQFWLYTKNGKIQSESLCLDYLFSMVILDTCRDRSSQVWLYCTKTQYIRNKETNLCLTVAIRNKTFQIIMETCKDDNSQRWNMENFDVGNLTPELQNCFQYKC